MPDEFVDFYEILDLPVEAERAEVRKRISELYVEAQKNLDHRNFNTRVKNQQLFEVTLPQARYILLDAGRRDDYDRLVRASRGPQRGAPVASGEAVKSAKTFPANDLGQGGGEAISPGAAPRIDALPDADPEAVAREREELWNKWKSGLQSAMERENARENKASDAATTPLADRIEAAQSGAPQPQAQSQAPRTQAAPAGFAGSESAPENPPRPKNERPKVKFDFGGASDNAPAASQNAPAFGADEPGAQEAEASAFSAQQIEERRVHHRREIIRAELENTGVKASFIGAALVLVPGVIAMTMFMSTYYPANKVSPLAIKSSGLAWLLWLIVLGILAYSSAYFLSKSLRRKHSLQLQLMNYEELLRHTHKDG